MLLLLHLCKLISVKKRARKEKSIETEDRFNLAGGKSDQGKKMMEIKVTPVPMQKERSWPSDVH